MEGGGPFSVKNIWVGVSNTDSILAITESKNVID